MKNFKEKVIDLISKFWYENGYAPNELWLGYKEDIELEKYINQSHITLFKYKTDHKDIRHTKKIEFDGLKVRYENLDSKFQVKYNPHY